MIRTMEFRISTKSERTVASPRYSQFSKYNQTARCDPINHWNNCSDNVERKSLLIFKSFFYVTFAGPQKFLCSVSDFGSTHCCTTSRAWNSKPIPPELSDALVLQVPVRILASNLFQSIQITKNMHFIDAIVLAAADFHQSGKVP